MAFTLLPKFFPAGFFIIDWLPLDCFATGGFVDGFLLVRVLVASAFLDLLATDFFLLDAFFFLAAGFFFTTDFFLTAERDFVFAVFVVFATTDFFLFDCDFFLLVFFLTAMAITYRLPGKDAYCNKWCTNRIALSLVFSKIQVNLETISVFCLII
ncbi:hypothetical protein [Kaarinaea lacus]